MRTPLHRNRCSNYIAASKTPTSINSRGRYNLACPASLLIPGKPELFVVVVAAAAVVGVDTTLGTELTVVCVGTGLTTGGDELKVGVVGTGTVGVVGTGGATVGVVGTGTGGGRGCVGAGPLIVVGPPTGPEQISPLSQHPIMPLLARAQ